MENVKSEIALLPPWHRQQRKCFHVTFFEPTFPTRKTQRGKIRGNFCHLGGLLTFAQGWLELVLTLAQNMTYRWALRQPLTLSSSTQTYRSAWRCNPSGAQICGCYFFPAGIHFNLAPDSYFIHSPNPQNQDRFTACTIWINHGGGKNRGTKQVAFLNDFLCDSKERRNKEKEVERIKAILSCFHVISGKSDLLFIFGSLFWWTSLLFL